MTTTAAADSDPPQAAENARRSRHGRRRRSTTPAELAALVGLAVAAGLVAVLASDAAPTSTGWIDAVERAGFATLVTLAGSRSRRWALVVGAALVGVAADGGWQLVGMAALLGTATLAFLGSRDRLAGAAIGGLIANTALHLEVGGPLGLESLVAMAATVPILVSAHRLLGSRLRRRWRIAGIVALVGAGVLAVLAGIGTALAIGPVEDAVAATRAGVAAAQDGQGDLAERKFDEARAAFEAADGHVGSVLTVGARLLPVVGPNLDSVQAAVSLGAELSGSARSIAADVDFDRLQRQDGGVDLALLAQFRRPVLDAAAVLDRADGELGSLTSPWLLGPLRERLDDLDAEVADLHRQTTAAALGVEHAPALLGAEGPRRYLFLLGNPAELRDLGGHLGNWAEVVVDDGRLQLVDVGGPLELSFPVSGPQPELTGSYPPPLVEMNPTLYPQNWGADPDLPTVAALSAELFAARTGRAIDGVVYADTAAFAAFLELTGPIPVPGTVGGLQLDSTNASDFLTRGQFAIFPDDRSGSTALEQLISTVFERLTTGTLPGPRRLSELFWPLVHDGDLQMVTLHDADRPLLDRFGLSGAVPDRKGGDLLAVINRNAGPNKLDAYLRRTTSVLVEWDPASGGVRSAVTVRLTNEAPAGGLTPTVAGNAAGQPAGTNVSDVSVITPFPLRSALVDGVRFAAQPQLVGDLWRHTVRVAVPPGGTVEVNFHLRGNVAAGADRYRMAFVGQPMALPTPVEVDLRSSEGPVDARGSTSPVDKRGRVALDGRADAMVSWSLQGRGRP